MSLSKALARWQEVIVLTLLVKLSLLAFSWLVNLSSDQSIFTFWTRWDSSWYIDIAQNWYGSHQPLLIAFYPLYPLTIKTANLLINNWSASAVLVALFFSVTASIALFELTQLDFTKEVAFKAVWFLNIFPTAYFLQAGYTESLFLTVSILTIYFYRQGQVLPAALSGIASTLTRVNGLLLLPTLLFETRKLNRNILILLITPVGFLIYLLINWITFGHPLYFLQPVSEHWFKQFQFPWIGLINQLSSFPSLQDEDFYQGWAESIAIILIAIASLIIFLKVRVSYAIYTLTHLVLLTSTGFILSTPRYMLVLFPIYIALALIKDELILLLISMVSIGLLFYLTYIYIQGGWAF